MSTGRHLFQKRGLHAKRSFGQCFLADSNIARKIARAAVGPEAGTVLEIGAGTGALTHPLLECGARVVAIERDRDLVPVLNQTLTEAATLGRLRIVEADAVSTDWLRLLEGEPRPHVVAGNVPYQVTGRLLERATEVAGRVRRVVFMIQKEVADRIEAAPGTKDYGALSVFVRRSYEVEDRFAVPPTCFRPQPSVHSAVVVLEPVTPSPPAADDILRTLVVRAFSKRRKTLRNAWRGVFGLDVGNLETLAANAAFSLDARAETLIPSQFDQAADWVRAFEATTPHRR